VEVVVSRYQGEKKTSSIPYLLTVNANAMKRGGPVSRLRMGAQIPIPTIAPPANAKDQPNVFRSNNDLIVRHGQTMQFTAATDRVNGDMIRVDVTLRVLK
jgi:hypothetical protein